MRSILLIICLSLSFQSLAVTLNPSLDGSDQVRFMRYLDAVREVEKVINSDEFTNRVLDMKFTSTKLESHEVLWKMDEAAEILKPEKDKVWDWKVGFYYKKHTRVIGWTTPRTMTVWVNTAKFDHFDLWDIADNIAHEYLHKIGFDHASARDHSSVPYSIGYLVRDMVKNNLMKKPDPVPNPVKEKPKTRRSWWDILRSYL